MATALALATPAYADEASEAADANSSQTIIVTGLRGTASTGTKTDTPLRDVPQAINVVPGELLREQAASSIEDALRNVPSVGASSGDGQRDQVTIRGFTAIADQFVDGLRDDSLYFRDLSGIERIEVLKGPAAVLYGRGSSGGLINRVTRKARTGEEFGDVTLTLGSFAQKRVEGDVNVPLGNRIAFRVTGAIEDADSYRDQQFLERHTIAPSLAVDLGEDTHAWVRYEYARDKRVTDFGIPSLNGLPVDVAASQYYGSANARQDDTTESHVNAISGVIEHRFSDGFILRNTTRYYDYSLDRNNTLPNGGVDPVALTVGLQHSAIFRKDKGWVNQTDAIVKTEIGGMEQEWLLGVEIGRQNKWQQSFRTPTFARVDIFDPVLPDAPEFTAVQITAGQPERSILEARAVYAQGQLAFGEHWKLLAGLRYDEYDQRTTNLTTGHHLDRVDKQFSPRAGLVWQPTQASSFYLSYSRSFQPTSEIGGLGAASFSAEPEITQNYEVGAKLDFLGGALSVTAALFNLERSNIKNTDPSNPSVQINVGVQRVRGLELTAAGQLPGGFALNAAYSYLDGEMIRSLATVTSPQSPVVTIAVQGKTPSLTPRHSGNIWLSKKLGHGFSVAGGVSYVGDRFASLSNAVVLPSYVAVDFAAFYESDDWRIAFNLKNALDEDYIVSSHGSNDNLILPGPPRRFSVSLTRKF